MTVVYCTLQKKFYQGMGFGRIAHANGIVEGLIMNNKDVEVWGDKGVTTHDFNGFNPKRIALPKYYFLKIVYLYRLLRALPSGSLVIIRKDLFSLIIFPFLKFFIKHIKIVKEVNGLFFDYTARDRSKTLRFISEFIHKVALRSIDIIYCVDEIIAQRLTSGLLSIDKKQIVIINNGGPSQILETPHNVKIREVRILYFGLISEYSELELFITAAQELNIGMDIVGEGPSLNTLKSMVKSLNFENIDFHGFQSMDYVKNLVKFNSKNKEMGYVGICPYRLGSSNKKFAPIKGFVYLSFNIPVLYSSLSYQGVFTDGIHGKQYTQGDIKELKKAIEEIRRNYMKYQSLVQQNYPELTWKSRMNELLQKA